MSNLFAGHIKDYDLFVFADVVSVMAGKNLVTKQKAKGLSEFMGKAKELKLGWVSMEDDMEIIYFYDKKDGNFGYAVNLQVDYFSEWGYAPFSEGGEK